MLTVSEDHGMISVLKIATNRLTSADFGALRQAQERAMARGRAAFLVDLSAVRRVTRSGLAALVEFQSEMPREVSIGFFGLSGAVKREVERCSLSRLLTVFDTCDAALKSPAFRTRRLAGVKAVLLVAGTGSRLAPVSQATPKPLLDVLGQSVVERVVQHLSEFGIKDFLFNPGHLGPQFHASFGSSALRNVQFFNEGRYVDNLWQAAPMGSASTLLAMQSKLSCFEDDFVVMCGDALTNVDIAEMIDQHRRTGADVTIAVQKVPRSDMHKYGIVDADGQGRITGFVEKPAPDQARSTLASTGIYIFSPRVLCHLSFEKGLDIARHLLPDILRAGGRMYVHEAPFCWSDIGCGRDYYRTVSRALRGLIPNVSPNGQEIRRQVWAAPGARVSPKAVIVGPCYIGANAEVAAGSKLDGPCMISANARVEARALVRRSIIMPKTVVTSGVWVDDMIAAGTWAVDHRLADGSPQPDLPLEGVVPFERGPAGGFVEARRVGGGDGLAL